MATTPVLFAQQVPLTPESGAHLSLVSVPHQGQLVEAQSSNVCSATMSEIDGVGVQPLGVPVVAHPADSQSAAAEVLLLCGSVAVFGASLRRLMMVADGLVGGGGGLGVVAAEADVGCWWWWFGKWKRYNYGPEALGLYRHGGPDRCQFHIVVQPAEVALPDDVASADCAGWW